MNEQIFYDETKAKTIAKFTKWIDQTKSITKIYTLLFFGAVAAPIAWLSIFYVMGIYLRRNPFLKALMPMPMIIMAMQTVFQGVLLYVNIRMTATSSGSTEIIHVVYFCTIIFFFLLTLIFSKIHFSVTKRVSQNIRNILYSNGELAIPKSLKEKAMDKINDVKQTLKEGVEALK
ncbi:hypothetical protein [Pseudomonas syringae]|uniref:hypothetical protein n=1 Tax=Pseudomonas syringae TaxID=317 RepID=UPI001F17C48F|nr:hypothetical protein [Pseudomonas syringae]MBL3827762.1 hypothetical protein [Pseudomonas syringae pv. theae]MBL3837186.1 hypothetical protein [Pseudomonas syringae pv. theae]GKQ45050.1 hypothetical protein PSTH2693_07860 [Pseudomonas syringae pv. theae]